MTGADSNSVQLSTEAQARVLIDPINQKILDVLLGQPCSAQELVRRTQLPMHRVHYRLRGLLQHGFIRVEHIQKRAGRPIKVYETTASSWTLPFDLTPSTDLADFFEQSSEQWLREVFRPIGQSIGKPVHFVFARHGPGPAYLDPRMAPEDQRKLDRFLLFNKDILLDPDQIEPFKAALQALIEQHQTEKGVPVSLALFALDAGF